MSERPWESLPPDNSTTPGPGNSQQPKPVSASTERHHDASASSAVNHNAPPTTQRSAGSGRGMELPPLPQQPSFPRGGFLPASRSAGVSSILNPDETTDSRRRKAPHLLSSRSTSATLPPLATSGQAGSGTGEAHTSAAPMSLAGPFGERTPRRILTPRSPSLHRATSLNQLNPPSATISTQHAPFVVSPHIRPYTIEPGTSGVPPLPTPPAAMRQNYGFAASTPPIQAARRASTSASRGMGPASESTSPRSSYSSYSQAGQASPATQHAPATMSTLSAPYATSHDPTVSGPGTPNLAAGSDRQRAVGVPISSSGGQNVYQMMTLETTSGTVQLPVDVQAASRVADEKRRRNAGASARFRQRRKEKEKEASTTIESLQQQVKELSEDMDFYKRERDYLAGVVLQVPGGERHFPRPQSPRLRRSSGFAGAISNSGYVSEQGMSSPKEGRNVRQRTSTISLPPPSVAGSATGTQSGYAVQPYGQPLAPQPAPLMPQTSTSLPSPITRPAHGQPAPGPPQLMHVTPHTGPWNPYADRRPPQGGAGPPREPR